MAPEPREAEPTLMPSFNSGPLPQLLVPPSVTVAVAMTWDCPGVSCEWEGVLVRDGDVEVGVGGLTQSWAGLPCVTKTGTVHEMI